MLYEGVLDKAMTNANEAFKENTALTIEAEKRYETTESQIQIMKNTFKDMGITIGSAVIPIFNKLLTAARPFIDQVGERLPALLDGIVTPAMDALSQVMTGIKLDGLIGGFFSLLDVFGFIGDSEEEAVAVWNTLENIFNNVIPGAITTLSTIWTTMLVPAFQSTVAWVKENLLPVFATLQSWFTQVLPLAIGVIATKWEEILLPALLALSEVWKTDIQPALEMLWEWMATNIPPILESLSVLFETVLKPAMMVVGTFISETLIPIIGMLVGKILTALVPILNVLTLLWQETLLPAIQAIWGFIEANLIPIITALAELIGAVLGLALDVIIGLFTALNDYLVENLAPHMETFGAWLNETFGPALEGISDWLQKVVDWFQKLKDKVSNIRLPDWMTPGSPTPLEIGLRGIASAMQELTTSKLPAFKAELDMLSVAPRMGGVAQAAMVAGPQVMPSNNVTINMGENNISTQIDAAMFEQKVLQVVTSAIA
jgi:phage-related protein